MGKRILDTLVGIVTAGPILFSGPFLLKSCAERIYGHYRNSLNSSRIETRDLNGNGLLEKFMDFEGNRYFLEIDGKNVQEYLQNRATEP
jgi:hypothetical protein